MHPTYKRFIIAGTMVVAGFALDAIGAYEWNKEPVAEMQRCYDRRDVDITECFDDVRTRDRKEYQAFLRAGTTLMIAGYVGVAALPRRRKPAK